jgi:hypothetical protein
LLGDDHVPVGTGLVGDEGEGEIDQEMSEGVLGLEEMMYSPESPAAEDEAALANSDSDLLDDEDLCPAESGLGDDEIGLPVPGDAEGEPSAPADIVPLGETEAPESVPVLPGTPALPSLRRPACTVHFVDGGKISYYERRGIVECVCNHPAHGKCVLTRSTNPSMSTRRASQGRPLGLAMAWLSKGPTLASKDSHWSPANWPTLAERLVGRAALMIERPDFLEIERPKADDEASEPEVAP